MADSLHFSGWLTRLGDDLATWSDDFDPGVLQASDLCLAVTDLERASRRLAVLKARVADETVRRDAWRSSGERTAEAWYAKVTGTSVGAAAKKFVTAQRRAVQPDVEEAWRQGDLSEDQAERVSEAAADDPDAARKLVARARSSSHRQLREECERVIAARRRAEDEEHRRRAWHAARSCRTWIDATGAGRLEACLTPEGLAELRACLEPFARAEFEAARREGRREPHEAYRADGLLAMARSASGRPADGATGAAASAVIAVISHQALVRGHCEGEETCHLDGIGSVPVSVVRDMMTDAFCAAVVSDGTDIRAVAHLGRQVTARQRTALVVRDPACVVPGCGAREGLEIDHVTGWRATHHTRLDELARLCRRHHRMKTYLGWAITGGPGNWRWESPDASPIPGAGEAEGLGGAPEQLFATAGAGPP